VKNAADAIWGKFEINKLIGLVNYFFSICFSSFLILRRSLKLVKKRMIKLWEQIKIPNSIPRMKKTIITKKILASILKGRG
jgi:hypothetical protein